MRHYLKEMLVVY